VILRHYVDIEQGNLFRALGRYNGSLGKPDYPNLVVRAWINHWKFDARAATRLAAGSPELQARADQPPPPPRPR